MQPNLKTFLVVAVMVVVALFAGLLYYLIYLNSENQLLAIIFGGVVFELHPKSWTVLKKCYNR